MPDRKAPPPLPPGPCAEIKAQFGPENLETVLGTYRAFADKVDSRALVSWTMKQPIEELLMPLFLAALIVIARELDLGAVAADLQAAKAAEVERDALAESLAATIAGLDAHIERRAQEIAEPRIDAAQRHAEFLIDGDREEREAERRRKDDLITELRRQLDALAKTSERQHRELKETRAAVQRVEALKVWTNEDRRQFVFADELWAALAECGSPAGRALSALMAAADERAAT